MMAMVQHARGFRVLATMWMSLLALAVVGEAQQLQKVRLAIPGDGNSAPFKALPAKLNMLFKDSGYEFEIVAAATDVDAVRMAVDGEADLAETDASGVIGLESKLQTVAVMVNGDGRTFYTAQAWVRSDATGIQTFADLRGKNSCHTGFRKSAGMYMPIGYGVRNNIIEAKQTLKETVVSFFADSCAAPEICGLCLNSTVDGQCAKDSYSDYQGALRCLSEKRGDVAFIKDSTYASTCGTTVPAGAKPAYCLPANQMRKLADVGEVPSHMLVASTAANTTLVASLRATLVQKITAANSADLPALMDGAIGFAEIPIGRHMANYDATVACVPEIAPGMECKRVVGNTANTNTRAGTQSDPLRFVAVNAETNRRQADLDLATALRERTGLYFQVMSAPSDRAAMEMLADNVADFADVDAITAVEALTKHNMESFAAEVTQDTGLPYYESVALVRANSGIQSFADLRGKRSCHTKFAGSAGMYMPIGYAVANGIVPAGDGKGELALKNTVTSFFSASCAAPVLCATCKDSQVDGQCTQKDSYADYVGALRCLSEGAGDVAFVRDSTFGTFCGPEAADRPDWCLAANEIRVLESFGRVPSHPIIVRMNGITQDATAKLKAALIELDGSKPEDQAILRMLNTRNPANGYAPVASLERHVADYKRNVACAPGAAQVMGANGDALPACETQMEVSSSSASESLSSMYDGLENDIDSARDIAIAGLVLAIIALVAIPLFSYLIARHLVARQQKKGKIIDDVDSEAVRRHSTVSRTASETGRLV